MIDFDKIYLFCYKNHFREGEAVIGNIEYVKVRINKEQEYMMSVDTFLSRFVRGREQ